MWQFVPFFALVLLGWVAARWRWVPVEGIGSLTSFVLYFGLTAMLFRLGAGGAFQQPGLWGVLVVYGVAGLSLMSLALWWGVRSGLSAGDNGLMALATAFPNTGFLGLPLLTGLLGPQAAGPLAATFLVDVLLLSSLCLAWAHSHSALKGALRNPLLWSMALGLGVSVLGWTVPKPVDETLRLLSLSATPTALFTLGAVLARSQMQQLVAPPGAVKATVWLQALLKLVAHPLLVWGLGSNLMAWGLPVSPQGLLTVILAAALPSASNVSMLAEREGGDTALVARLILWTTAFALISLSLWSALLGCQNGALPATVTLGARL